MKYERFISAIGILVFSAIVLSIACKKNTTTTSTNTNTNPPGPQLVFVFKFDSTQARLNNLGQPATMPAGHSGQSPVFNTMSSHYIELAPSATTPFGNGDILYRAPEVGTGSNLAIEFSKCSIVSEGAAFYSCPISSVTPGTYQWLRVSLAYQNYNIKWSAPSYSITNAWGTVASFIGFNNFITSYKIKDSTVAVNGNEIQGYGGFEYDYSSTIGKVVTWQGKPGATTVPNPIASTSPIPAGSCVVTGQFVNSAQVATPFNITGKETANDTIVVSVSTNKSFEWKDANMNGQYEPLNGDTVVDMGVRGMIPVIK